MKLSLLAAASVAALAVSAGTASAQYPVLVPHRNHYHVVPAYPSYPVYGGGYGVRTFSPGLSLNLNFGSPRGYGYGNNSGFRYGGGQGYRYGGGSGYRYGGGSGYRYGGGHGHGHNHR